MRNNLGTNAHIPRTETLDKIKEGNISWVRMDFNWDLIEPEKGIFNFDYHDDAVTDCNMREINVLGILAYTPKWANGDQDKSYLPLDYDDWIRYVHKVVHRYGSKVKHWEIWNEPNDHKFFKGTLKEYGEKILAYASDTIRNISNDFRLDLKIVAPSINCNRTNWPVWLKELEWYAKRKFFDISSIHLYRYPARDVIDGIEKGKSFAWLIPFRRPIRQYLDKIGLPCWITETGWSTMHTTYEAQKNNYKRLLQYTTLYSTIDRVFFYEIMDDPNTPEKFGILTDTYSEKPAYKFLKSLW